MTSATSRTRILDPLERFSEIVFGLIMVLSFTCAISVAEIGRIDRFTMLADAIDDFQNTDVVAGVSDSDPSAPKP